MMTPIKHIILNPALAAAFLQPRPDVARPLQPRGLSFIHDNDMVGEVRKGACS